MQLALTLMANQQEMIERANEMTPVETYGGGMGTVQDQRLIEESFLLREFREHLPAGWM